MSDAATPFEAPAGGGDPADTVISLLEREDAGDDAAPEARQPTSEAQTDDDYAEDQSQGQDPEPEAEEPPEPPKYRVKVRGAEVEVPLPELLAGYSRTEDYKAKTAEIAEQRRALEAKQAEITTHAQRLAGLINQAPHDPVLAEGQKTDWTKLAQDDPAGYVAKRAAYDARVAYWSTVMSEAERAQVEQMRAERERNEAVLAEKLPDWRDEAKRKAIVNDVRNALVQHGFSDAELAGLVDHRMVMVALDAAKWRKAEAARKSAEAKKVAPAPRTMAPTAPQAQVTNERARAVLNRAKNSGSTDAIIDAVTAVLGR